MKRQKQTRHTFKVESFFDKVGQYTAICCSMTGEILRHESEGKLFDQEPEQEETKEIKNANQLSIF